MLLLICDVSSSILIFIWKGDFLITDNIVLWDTEFGKIKCKLKKVMKNMNINIYQLERISGIKYDVLKRYCNDYIVRYDSNVLAKLCFSLNCEISELLQYERSKN